MNVNKHYILGKQDTHLLYKGSQRYKGIKHNNPNTCVPDDIRDMLDNAFKKKKKEGIKVLV